MANRGTGNATNSPAKPIYSEVQSSAAGREQRGVRNQEFPRRKQGQDCHALRTPARWAGPGMNLSQHRLTGSCLHSLDEPAVTGVVYQHL